MRESPRRETAAARRSVPRAGSGPSRGPDLAKSTGNPARVDLDALRLGEALEFLRLIWALDHGLQSRSKRMRATIGLTGPQRLVIRIVSRYPRILAGELAAVLHLHPSTLTGILDRLEKRRLLTRRPDDRDRRRTVLEVTRWGKRLDLPSAGTIEASVARALTAFPRSKLDATREVLATLTHELTEVSSRKVAIRPRSRTARRSPRAARPPGIAEAKAPTDRRRGVES